MKKYSILLTLLLWTGIAIAQQYEEIIYLKNGSRIKGTVIETTAEQAKIKMYDGSIIIYKIEDISKITKENIATKDKKILSQIRSKKWATKGYRPRGYAGFLNVEYNVGKEFERPQYLSLASTHGYQLNPHVFVGGGAAIQFPLDGAWGFNPTGSPSEINGGKYSMKNVLSHREFDVSTVGVVIYGSTRLFLFDNKYTPYLDLRIGYSTTTKGCYISPMIGASIGRFDIGIGILCQQIQFDDTYSDFEYSSYSEQWLEKNKKTPVTDKKFKCGFSVRIGVNF